MPEKSVINYLSQPPFQVESKILKEYITKDSLELELTAIENLIQFINDNREAPFAYLCISESQEPYRYLISFKEGLYQYYSEQVELNNYIQQHLSQTFKKLPVELYNKQGNNEGLLQGEDLYNELLDEGNLAENLLEQLIIVIKKCKYNEIQLRFLQEIPNFTLIQGKEYKESSFEFQILELASHLLLQNPELLETFRKKITIRDQEHNEYELKAIAVNNEVIFNFTDNTYKLKLSEILPESENEAIIIDEIITHFEIYIPSIKELLGIEISKDVDEIYKDLVEDYQLLQNAPQLAFIFLYIKENEDIELLNHFSILNILNDPVNLTNPTFYNDGIIYLYFQKYNFIDRESILNQNYQGIDQLLKFDFNNSFAITDELTWVYEPYFDEDEIFHCYSLKEELNKDTESQKNLFYLMYEKWLKQKPKKISISETYWSNENNIIAIYNNDNLENAIGFNPNSCIFPDHFALKEEKLPQWVQNWIDNTSEEDKKSKKYDKYQFLAALGVNTKKSNIVKLRDSIQEKKEFKPDWSNINPRLLIKTLSWLCHIKVNLTNKNSTTLKLIKNIYDNIEDFIEEQDIIPLIVLKNLDQETIEYEFTIESNSKLYSYNSSSLAELCEYQLKLKDIFIIIQNQQYLLVDKTWYPEELLDKICVSISEITDEEVLQEVLNTKLLSQAEELDDKYYIIWKSKIKSRFKIKLYPGQIPYQVKFENEIVRYLEKGDIVIDDDNNIYLNSSLKHNLEEQLEKLINNSSFTYDDLHEFKTAKQLSKEEITKIVSKQQDDTDIYASPSLIKCSENDFRASRYVKDWEAFTSKLLSQLNNQNSEWKEYIYHFTHVENAVSILNRGSLFPRGKLANFKDSAGSNLINRTSDYVKDNFARFYFRPLTPTQWHNELLGRRKGNIKAICPIPIFFCFKIKDVLETHKSKCAVSNGNLSADWACYGNSVDFLNYFDFDNLYKKFGQDNYKIASQQEFIIKDGLQFSDKIDFKIICRNEQDKKVLLNLISYNNKYAQKIEINSHFYNNESPWIKIKKNDNSLDIYIEKYNNNITGIIYLNLKQKLDKLSSIASSSDIVVHLDKYLKIKSSQDISLKINSSELFDFTVSFVEDNTEWLIFKES